MIVKTVEECKDICYFYIIRRNVHISLTEACNINCPGCYLHRDGLSSQVISKENIIYALDLAAALVRPEDGKNQITIFGGEPTLEMELLEFTVEEAKKRGLLILLITNGWWGKDPQVMQKLYDLDIDAMAISCDDIHNNVDCVNLALKKFEDHKITRTLIAALHTKENILSRLENKEVYILPQEFIDNRGYNSYRRTGNTGYCTFDGLNVFPDGEIRCECALGRKGCYIGKVGDDIDSIVKLMDKIYDYFPFFKSDPDLTYCFNHPDMNIFDMKIMNAPGYSMDYLLKRIFDPSHGMFH